MQEDEDNDEHQHARFKKRVVDLIEGCFDEDRRVVRRQIVKPPLREMLCELGDAGLDGFGGCHGVRSRLQINANVDARLSV